MTSLPSQFFTDAATRKGTRRLTIFHALANHSHMSTIDEMYSRLQGDFPEMPGRVLKRDQVQRLCSLDRTMCDLVLESLIDTKFLYQTSDGAYARLSDGELLGPRPAQARLITTVP